MTNEFIQQNFVTPEIAKALKELGFNEPCFGYYYPSPFFVQKAFQPDTVLNTEISEDYYSAPLWQQAVAYLNDRLSGLPLQKVEFAQVYMHDLERMKLEVITTIEILKSQQSTH